MTPNRLSARVRTGLLCGILVAFYPGMAFFSDFLAGVASGLSQDEQLDTRDSRGLFNGSIRGRGDGGADFKDERNRYKGKMVPSLSGDGWDVYDERGIYQGTIRK